MNSPDFPKRKNATVSCMQFNHAGLLINYVILKGYAHYLVHEKGGILLNGVDAKKPDYNFLPPREVRKLPGNVATLYKDLQMAFILKSDGLTASGIRTILYTICQEKKLRSKSLRINLKKLQEEDFITWRDVYALDKILLAGGEPANAFIHLSDGELNEALEVINHLLRTVFNLSGKRRT